MKLLGKSASINVRKVLWTCAELGLDVAREELPDLGSPEFRRLNPNAMVPVLIDGDFVLWESNSICRYLAGRDVRITGTQRARFSSTAINSCRAVRRVCA